MQQVPNCYKNVKHNYLVRRLVCFNYKTTHWGEDGLLGLIAITNLTNFQNLLRAFWWLFRVPHYLNFLDKFILWFWGAHKFCNSKILQFCTKFCFWLTLPPFSLIHDFGKQNTLGNISKISVNHTCYWQIGSKSTNHSPLAWRKEGLKVTLGAVIGGFWSDLLITRKTDRNFGNVSTGVLFSKVAYQQKRW